MLGPIDATLNPFIFLENTHHFLALDEGMIQEKWDIINDGNLKFLFSEWFFRLVL
jgi:hypothetical protein